MVSMMNALLATMVTAVAAYICFVQIPHAIGVCRVAQKRMPIRQMEMEEAILNFRFRRSWLLLLFYIMFALSIVLWLSYLWE